jgi:hypothetical protein
MVSLETSQIKQFTERFFHQSGFLRIYHGTRYSIAEFFSLGSKIKLYEENKNQMNQNPIQLDCSYI